MQSDPELKRLHWRAHHRGTREADFMIGGFFDAHCAAWSADERKQFDALKTTLLIVVIVTGIYFVAQALLVSKLLGSS